MTVHGTFSHDPKSHSMTPAATAILHHLQTVASERGRRAEDPVLASRVTLVKDYQHRRFAKTYADLLSDARFKGAAAFFLDDLYGPHDFTERDAQFARIVPALVKLFPGEIIGTVEALAELHALSETLDTRMASSLSTSAIDAALYIGAWRAVGAPEERARQIVLMLEVGGALDRYTRRAVLRQALRLMRGPARAAGLGALQAFLEKGFDTFREMQAAREFLDTIAERERSLAAALFGIAGSPRGLAADGLIQELP